MDKLRKDEAGFSVVEAVLIVAVFALIGTVGRWAYQHHLHTPTLTSGIDTSDWVTYKSACFHYSFKAPASLTVKVREDMDIKTVSCGLSPTDTGSLGVNDWASVTASIGNLYIGSLPKGADIIVSAPMPVGNSDAMQFAGFHKAGSVSKVLKSIVSSTESGSTSALVTINGRQAALVETISPDKKPSNFLSVDTPYCPCTSEEVTLDTGAGSILQISANRLNSDKQAGKDISGIIGSFKFQ